MGRTETQVIKEEPMITYEFTAGKTDPIFTVNLSEKQKLTEYLEVPLRLLIPRRCSKDFDADQLQDRITAAVEKMVTELNTPTKL